MEFECQLPENWREIVEKNKGIKPNDIQKAGMKSVYAPGGPTFNLIFMDLDGHPEGYVGFNDPVHGESRRQVFADVCYYLSSVLDHPRGVCDVQVQHSQTDGLQNIAFAYSTYPILDAFVESIGMQRIRFDPIDPDPDYADIEVTVDFGFNWNNTSNTVSAGEIDLFSVLLHEMTHGIGFTSLTYPDGTSILTQYVPGTRTFNVFDNYIYQANPLVKMWNDELLVQALPALNSGTTTGLLFNGPLANAAHGRPTYLHSPANFVQGSTAVHWSDSSTMPTTAMMKRSFLTGTQRRVFMHFELAALRDLGYSIQPEAYAPGVWMCY